MTGLAGLGAAVPFGVGNALWAFDQPVPGAATHTIVAFYAGTSARIIAGASLSLIACVPLVLFGSGVRAILVEHEDRDLLANSAFGGVLILVAAGLGAETINMAGALRANHGQLTPGLATAVFEISYVLGFNAAGVGVAILLLAVAAVALREQALMSRQVALLLLLAGLAFLTPLARFLLGPSVLLLAVVSVRLLRAPAADTASIAV